MLLPTPSQNSSANQKDNCTKDLYETAFEQEADSSFNYKSIKDLKII